MHLGALIEGYFIVRKTRLAATTQRNYRYCAAKLLAFFGPETPVESITSADLLRFADFLLTERGLSPRSVHDYLAICSSFWTFAADELGIPNIVNKVPRPDWEPRQIEPLSEDQVRALVRSAEWSAPYVGRRGKPARGRRPTAPRDVAILLVLVDTGIRASELCGLEMRDYDQAEGRLHIRHGKGDKERSVYLGTNAQRSLWRYLATRKDTKPTDSLFVVRNGSALDRNNLRHLLERIGHNARVADVHPHRFRHTFAIIFLRNGGNIYELQRILGHEKLDTVQTYLKLAQSDIATAQRKHSPADGWKL